MALPRRIGLLIAVVASLLALPVAARAEVYCVDVSGGDCTSSQPAFQTALNQAALNAGNDTVRLGATTYNAPPTIGFSYTGGNGSVSIIGQGQGSTILTVPAQPDVFAIHPVLVLGSVGGGSSVSELTITLPAPTPPNANVPQYRGIHATTPTISDVTINGSSSPTNGLGMLLTGGTVRDTTISLPTGVGFPPIIGISASDTTTIEDSTILADTAIRASGTSGALTVRRTSLLSNGDDGDALRVQAGSATIESSTIDLGSFANSDGIEAGNPNNGGAETIVVNGDHLTITNGGSNSTGFRLFSNDPSATDNNSTTLTNTVISGPTAPIRRNADNGDTANVSSDYSNYNAAANVSSNGTSGSGAITETNLTNHAPGFVDAAAGNLHLLSTSPLIDIGDPASPGPAVLDMDGDPRAVMTIPSCAPRRDIGADEFVPASPVIPLVCAPLDASPPDTFLSGKRKVRTRKRKARVTWILGTTELGSSFECSLDGAPFVPCTSPFSAKLRRGAHTLTARATDALGNQDSTPASFTTRVKRKR